MTQKVRDWDELERLTGIKRNVPPAPTRRDAANLTLQRLRGRFWRRKRR